MGYRVNSEPLWMGNLVKYHLKVEVSRSEKTWLSSTAPDSNTRTAKKKKQTFTNKGHTHKLATLQV